VDGQLPPALNVRKPTPGKHQQAKLALSRAGGKRAKCDSSCGKGGRNRQNVQYPRKAAKKINTQLDIRYAFFDPAPGPRVRYQLPASSTLSKLRSFGKRSTTILCQRMNMKGAVSKAEGTPLQQTVVPSHLATFCPFS